MAKSHIQRGKSKFKVKVKAKKTMDKVKAYLLEKEVNNWINKPENSKMMEDYVKLASDVLFYKIKWGIPVELVIGELEEPKGRQLGKSLVDKLFK